MSAYQPIENHGVIGDLHTVALVGMDGSIDFMCFPHFDSPSIFAALLDDAKGGRFRLAPTLERVRHKQLYLPDTNILLTRFLSEQGVAEVTDFMPIAADGEEHSHDLIRRAKCVRGEVRFRMVCAPRFDYARAGHRAARQGRRIVFESEGSDRTSLRLSSPVEMNIVEGDAVAEFTLHAGESVTFILECMTERCILTERGEHYAVEAFKETFNFWHNWIGRSNYRGRWREMVNRSALTLKLLVSKPHGSMVASPTFGLPEHIGGTRNWDYRYTWVRDASFTLYGLMRLGYTDEAQAFMNWIEARCGELNPDGSLQIMYGIDGRHELTEQELGHLAGYRGSRPVRIGNGAYDQLQLDIYGELMDSVYLHNKYGQPISFDLWQNLVRLLDWVAEHWDQPDEGIWEVRGARRKFLFSRLMCWVALDRGVRLAFKRSLPGPVDRWRNVRDTIHLDIMRRFWNPRLKAFTMAADLDALDASCLLMPLVRFISPTDPKWLSTLAAIERRLVDDSLVFRYDNDAEALGERTLDGLGGVEGTFCMCSFWYVECLARAGDLRKARFLFEKMLGYANHLGLYAEELGPAGEHLGNFPQAFTHLALISAAFDLDRRLGKGAD